MADNTTLNAGTGGDVIATDDIGGVKYQRVKVVWGADGAATDTADSTGAALPVKVKEQIPGTGATNLGKAEDNAHSSGDTGVAVLAVRRDTRQSDVAAGDYACLHVDALNALRVTNQTSVDGGASVYRRISTASTNALNVKASAGQVYGWYLYNANAATRYLKVYNKATTPTVGSDTPALTIPIPPGSGANVEFTNGIKFDTGIGFALVTGMADSDATAVAANEIVVNLLYL